MDFIIKGQVSHKNLGKFDKQAAQNYLKRVGNLEVLTLHQCRICVLQFYIFQILAEKLQITKAKSIFSKYACNMFTVNKTDPRTASITFWCLKASNFRSSHQRCSLRKGVPRNFAKFTGKHPCQSLFLNKVTGLRAATLLKKRLWHRCFPVNFVKFLRTPFLQKQFL